MRGRRGGRRGVFLGRGGWRGRVEDGKRKGKY